MISAPISVSICIAHTLLFVLSFYVTAPPSFKHLHRDTPVVIIHRIKSLSVAVLVSVIYTMSLLISERLDIKEAFNGIGFGIFGIPQAAVIGLLSVATLYIGPIVYRHNDCTLIHEHEPMLEVWRNYILVL
jgi:hypothetical protein